MYGQQHIRPLDERWQPAPMAYAGWFGCGEMRCDAGRLIVRIITPHFDLEEWRSLLRGLADFFHLDRAVLRDGTGRPVAGIYKS